MTRGERLLCTAARSARSRWWPCGLGSRPGGTVSAESGPWVRAAASHAFHLAPESSIPDQMRHGRAAGGGGLLLLSLAMRKELVPSTGLPFLETSGDFASHCIVHMFI